MVTTTVLTGRVAWIFAEPDFDVDRTIGVANIENSSPEMLALLCMKDIDPGFVDAVSGGDFLVGASNFGYGHPHAQAMLAMRQVGIAGVVAESFSPDFLKGEAMAGFPLVACPGIVAAVERFDVLEIDWCDAVVTNLTRQVVLKGTKLPAHLLEMVAEGGLLPHLRKRYRAEKKVQGS